MTSITKAKFTLLLERKKGKKEKERKKKKLKFPHGFLEIK